MAVSQDEKWYLTILGVICLYYQTEYVPAKVPFQLGDAKTQSFVQFHLRLSPPSVAHSLSRAWFTWGP